VYLVGNPLLPTKYEIFEGDISQSPVGLMGPIAGFPGVVEVVAAVFFGDELFVGGPAVGGVFYASIRFEISVAFT
jgi:hypothetical protein